MGSNTSQIARELPVEDAELVDLLRAVLVDPNLYTDLRMRLHHEISAVLRAVGRDLRHKSVGEVGQRPFEARDGHLPELLTTVLVDPNLHSDLRTRLHREIRAILRAARPEADDEWAIRSKR